MFVVNQFLGDKFNDALGEAVKEAGGLNKFCRRNALLSSATVSRIVRGHYGNLKLTTVMAVCNALEDEVKDYFRTVTI